MTVQLFCGDCLEIMPKIGKVDAVVTDPPYNIGISSNPIRQKHEKKQWDCEADMAQHISMILKYSEDQIIWGGNYFNLPPSKCFVVWDKKQPFNFSLAMAELAWCSLDYPAKIISYCNRGDEEKLHPTQKPIEVMEFCIKLLLMRKPNIKYIVDPFMGSGSTGAACVGLDLNFIGIEKDPQYFEIAKERIAEAERRKNNEFFVKKPDAPTLFDFMLEDKQ